MACSSSSHARMEPKTPKFFGFHTFTPGSFTGAFRDNIRQFLQQCAEPEDYKLENMQVWSTFLVYESNGIVIPLYTVEEDVKFSQNPFCDYCRFSGWGKNFVSRRRYHFIIPADDDWDKRLDQTSFDVQTHLLHGLIHANGYGHLLCVNGIEGGSKLVRGQEIMDLWDRICTVLQTRQISVEDLSTKHNIDLRLLYGIAYGHSWFGTWGYRFCLGSFGVKEHDYGRAISILCMLKLNDLCHVSSYTQMLKQIIRHYRQLSQTDLVTVRDLFRFMLAIKSSSSPEGNSAKLTPLNDISKISCPSRSARNSFAKKKPSKCRKFSNLAANMGSRWPVRRLQQVAEVIVDALKEKRSENGVHSCGMTRQEARDAARLHIGDTGLIDHVLKSMNNVIVGNHVVRRAVNRSTKVLEYTIHDSKGANQAIARETVGGVYHINPGRSVWNDIAYLCNSILLDYPKNDSVKLAIESVLHGRLFVKEWPFKDTDDYYMRFICKLATMSFDLDEKSPSNFWPSEYVVVPPHATVGDLKLAAQNAMRDTYCVTENFCVSEIQKLEGVQHKEVLFGVVESGMEVLVWGYGLDTETNLRHEGGSDNWTVRCKCGALDDDGERMVSCDICEVWHHTKCSGINDDGSVPRFFICGLCCDSLAPSDAKCRVSDDPELDSLVLPYTPELDEGLILQFG